MDMGTPPPPDSDPEALAETALAAAAADGADGHDAGAAAGARGRDDGALHPGRIIDATYQIESLLGAGGMGRVYRAKDLRLGREVAIKVHGARAHDPHGQRLEREAAALARLNHPNVVTVYGVGTVDDQPWIAMEHVPGGTARTWLAATPRSPREIIACYVAAGRGLAAAHAAGLVHRDFKPDNVLVGADGRVRVADFGLARASGPALPATARPDDVVDDLTRTGAVMGTPAYMAPEQRTGGAVGPAADQFAFAVALWEAVVGTRPFRGTTERELADAVARGSIDPLPAGRMPRHVERALRRALAIDPAARWPTMDALLDAVTHDPAARRRRVAIAVAAVGVLAGGAALVLGRGGHGDAAAPCGAVAAELDRSWNPARATQFETTLAAAGASDDARAAVAAIDRWAAAWRRQRVEVCEAVAARGQTATLIDLRGHCLARARAALDETVAVLAAPTSDLVGRARQLIHDLPDPAGCADVPALVAGPPPPSDPAARAAMAELQSDLARIDVLLAAGRAGDAQTLARDLLTRADAAGRPSQSAAARLALGRAMVADGTYDGVLPLLEESARQAASAHDDVLTADVWLGVLDLLGSRLEDAGEAERLLVVADAAIVRGGSLPRQVARLDVVRGDLDAKRGDFAGARAALDRALAAQEALYGPDDPILGLTLSRRAATRRQLDDLAGARADLERAATLLERSYGGRHPHLAAVLTNLGTTLQLQGDLAGARRTLERSLAIKEALLGPDHLELAPALVNLTNTLLGLDDLPAAQRAIERALAIAEQRLPPTHPKLGLVIGVLADVQSKREDWAGAVHSLDRALTFDDAALRDDLLLSRGIARQHLHDLRGARADLEEAARLVRAERGPTSYAAGEVAVALAQLAVAEGHRARGLDELRAAIAVMTAARGADDAGVKEAERQLAALRGGVAP